MSTRKLSEQLGLVRMATTFEVRADADGRKTLRGIFTPFDQWATINSWEGHFRERSVRGAFHRTISQSWDTFKRIGRHSIVVQYNHAMDGVIGTRQLGSVSVLEERDEGPYYEVRLLDTDYNREYIIPAAEDGLLGASYRFAVPKGGDEWNRKTDDGIPERTIRDAAVFEFGPVDHPAFEAATAGVRSAQEYELWQSLDEEGRNDYARLVRRAHDLGTSAPELATTETTTEPVSDTSESEPASSPVEAPDGRKKQRRYLRDKSNALLKPVIEKYAS